MNTVMNNGSSSLRSLLAVAPFNGHLFLSSFFWQWPGFTGHPTYDFGSRRIHDIEVASYPFISEWIVKDSLSW